MASTFRIRSIWNYFPPSLLQTTWSFATCRFTKNSKADCMAWLMGRASWLGCKTNVEVQQNAPFGIYLKLILPFKRMWYIQNAFFWWQQPLVMFLHTQQTPHGIKHNTTLERENKNHRILTINFWVPEKIQHGGVSKPLSSVGFLFLKTFAHPNFPPFKGEGSKHEGHSYCSTCPGYYETTWFLSPLSIHPKNKNNSQLAVFFVGSSGMKRLARGPVAFRMARPISTLGNWMVISQQHGLGDKMGCLKQ